jgi:dynein heavy chain, axonemal
VTGYEQLKKMLDDKLAEYNESNTVMNLVLFQQAMEHVCRIARIIDLPRGNAMLVGVGGSGKQSLARLASFICGYDVFQIAVSGTYGVSDFKESLLHLYTKAGMKGQPVTFLMTDNQIVNEKFLVFLNDLLSTGLVSDLCSAEDVDVFSNSVRNEVKAAGIMETPGNLWDFFIEKIRRCAPGGVWSNPCFSVVAAFSCSQKLSDLLPRDACAALTASLASSGKNW